MNVVLYSNGPNGVHIFGFPGPTNKEIVLGFNFGIVHYTVIFSTAHINKYSTWVNCAC